MSKHVLKLAAVFFIGLAVVSCKKSVNKTDAKKAEEVPQVELASARYAAVVDSSTVSWKGFAPTKSHNGTIKISEGYFSFDEGKLTGGNFVIDMKTIDDVSVEDEKFGAKLEGHLASADFFDVEKHPFSVFAITNVEESNGKLIVKGNLMVKNIKKNIEFPAQITMNGDMVTFKSEPFTIDRTEWDVMYSSGKLKETLKDKLINDEIEFVLEVNAAKS